MTTGHEGAHWIEVVDGRGLLPVQMLGPYASARIAHRTHRGVMRLLNPGRYSAAVVSQRALEACGSTADSPDEASSSSG